MATSRIEFVQGKNHEEPTELSKLSEDLLNAFKSTRFSLGKVPDVVPPLEYR